MSQVVLDESQGLDPSDREPYVFPVPVDTGVKAQGAGKETMFPGSKDGAEILKWASRLLRKRPW